jgi:hypothetical protein
MRKLFETTKLIVLDLYLKTEILEGFEKRLDWFRVDFAPKTDSEFAMGWFDFVKSSLELRYR